MKVICIELKILIMIALIALLLGIITVTPCTHDKPSVLGRCYGIDSCRIKELMNKAKHKMPCCK